MRVPQNYTVNLVTAATQLGHTDFDLEGVDRGSIQLAATLTVADTDVVTLQLSNDGSHFVAFAVAKTVTFTGGTTDYAVFELGAIDYRYLRVNWAAPSAHALTLDATVNFVATLTQGV